MSTVVVVCLLLLVLVLLVGYKAAVDLRRKRASRKSRMNTRDEQGPEDSPLSKRTRITLIKPDNTDDSKSP